MHCRRRAPRASGPAGGSPGSAAVCCGRQYTLQDPLNLTPDWIEEEAEERGGEEDHVCSGVGGNCLKKRDIGGLKGERINRISPIQCSPREQGKTDKSTFSLSPRSTPLVAVMTVPAVPIQVSCITYVSAQAETLTNHTPFSIFRVRSFRLRDQPSVPFPVSW